MTQKLNTETLTTETLTHAQIDALGPGREMDALVAVMVMPDCYAWYYRIGVGLSVLWERQDLPVDTFMELSEWPPAQNRYPDWDRMPHFSTHDDDSGFVVDKILSRKYYCKMVLFSEQSFALFSHSPSFMTSSNAGQAETRPLAICRAALHAMVSERKGKEGGG